MTRRLLLAVLIGLIVGGVWGLLPPRARVLALDADPLVVSGAVHVHTQRSDGTGTIDDVAQAAAAAGLDFVVLTDHGDGTRPPEPPGYRHGVLVIDAVEISTTGGHYIALGVPASPYRLGGEPRDVIEDVHRLGGFGIVAHPDSPKDDLRWREWQAPFDGMEWLNADSAWRDESRGALARMLVTYWFRSPESIAALFDRPATALARFDALSRRRHLATLAGHDAHARVGLRGNWEPREGDWSLRLPSYRAAFRAFANRVQVTAPLARVPSAALQDAARVLEGLRNGRVFTVLDALGGPARLAFTATDPRGRYLPGDRLPEGDHVQLSATLTPAVAGARLHLYRNGEPWSTTTRGALASTHEPAPGGVVYRIEVDLPDAPGRPPVPWIVSNPITVGAALEAPAPQKRPRAVISRPVGSDPGDWRIERHPQSASALEPVPPGGWRWSWRLAGGNPSGQYSAAVAAVAPGALDGMDRVALRAHASRPMRISVQLRVPEGEGLRWRRSVYLDTEPREVTVFLDELTPIEAPPGTPLDTAGADSLLFVADTVNALPGDGGDVWISDLRWGGAEDRVTSGP